MGVLSERENKYIAFATYFTFLALMIQILAYKIVGVSESSLIHNSIIVIVGAMMLICTLIWIKYVFLKVLLLFLIIGMILVVQFILFPENRQFIIDNYLFTLLTQCIPCLINMSILSDEAIHIKSLKLISLSILILGEIYFILSLIQGQSIEAYNMSYSYYMLLPALFYCYLYYEENRIVYIVASIISVISIFAIGSRGALLAWGIYFVISIMLTNKKLSIRAFSIAVISFFILFRTRIILLVSMLFNWFSFGSRNLQMILDNTYMTSSGRDIIRENAKMLIFEEPLCGYGLGGEIRLLGTYSHNMFIDLWIQFGLIFGSFIIVLLIYVMFKAFIYSKNRFLFLMLFAYAFIPIMVSGTYLTDIKIWVFIGFCIRFLKLSLVWGKNT